MVQNSKEDIYKNTMCIRTQSRLESLIEAEMNDTNDQDNVSCAGKNKVMNQDIDSSSDTDDSTKQAKKREIQHNYHDHANDDGAIYLETPVVSKGGVTVPFPMKLHNMLEHIALFEPDLASIVTWQPHGRCFLVHNTKAFASSVLSRFFQQRKYASFQRQLNLYGFNRITKGPDRGSYYHELFLRSKQVLCRGMTRMKVKGTGSRMASNPDQEPNFYLMSSMPASVRPEAQAPVLQTNPDGRAGFAQPQTTMYAGITNRPMTSVASMPMPRVVTAGSENKTAFKSNDPDDLNFVFDDMPFYNVPPPVKGGRRHSLMDEERRLSIIQNHRQSSIASLNGGAGGYQQQQTVTPLQMPNQEIIRQGRRLSMQFARRNSLTLTDNQMAETSRRFSRYISQGGSTIPISDSQYEKELEMLSQLDNRQLTDNELGDLLDKITDQSYL